MPFGNFKALLFLLLFIGSSTVWSQATDKEIYARLDEFLAQPSEAHKEELLRVMDSASDKEDGVALSKVVAYCNLGYTEARSGALPTAIDYYEKGTRLFTEKDLDDYDIIEYGLKPLGNLHTKTQALSEAETTIKQYILLAKEQQREKQEIAGIINLSTLYHVSSRFSKAKSILLQALKALPDHYRLNLNLANTYFALNKMDEAKELLKELLDKDRTNAEANRLLAQIYIKDEEYAKANAVLKSILQKQEKTTETVVRDRAKTHLALAESYFSNSKVEQAQGEILRVFALLIPDFKEGKNLPEENQLFPETLLIDALDVQAELLVEKENLKEAVKAYKHAQKVSDFLFDHLFLQDSKLLQQHANKDRAEKMMDLYYHLYVTTEDAQWVEEAVDLDREFKGKIVDEAAGLKDLIYEESAENSELYEELQNRLFTLNAELQARAEEDIGVGAMEAMQQEYNRLLGRLRMQYDSIQTKIDHNNPKLKAEDIQEKTGDLQQVILSYFMGEKAVYQLLISPEDMSLRKLTNTEDEHEEFQENIRRYSRLFESPELINDDVPSFVEKSVTLYEQLQIPSETEQLVVVPDGILSFVPFQTLLTTPTDTKEFQEMPFLLYNQSVSYLLSLNDYGSENTELTQEPSVLGVFPVFEGTPHELSFSVDEAKSIAKFFQGKTLMHDEASSSGFMEKNKDYDVLHLSSHALGGNFEEEATLMFSDKTLPVSRFYNLHFTADLVVLSACDTGIGRLMKGEGPMSLARGFQYAGAENMLFSLWEVNDMSTSELMHFYYQNLKKYRSRDLANHRASINYLEDGQLDNSRKSPYYWGAFVYYGTTDVPVQIRDLTAMVWIGTFMVLGFFGWLVYRQNRKKRASESNKID